MTADAVQPRATHNHRDNTVLYDDIVNAKRLAEPAHPHGDYHDALKSFRSLRQPTNPDGLKFVEHGTQLVDLDGTMFRQDHFVVDHSYLYRLMLLVQYDPFGGAVATSYELYYSYRRTEFLDVTVLAICERCSDEEFVRFVDDVARHLLTIVRRWLEHTLATSVKAVVPEDNMLVAVVKTLQELRTRYLVPKLNVLNLIAQGFYPVPVKGESSLTELPPELCFKTDTEPPRSPDSPESHD